MNSTDEDFIRFFRRIDCIGDSSREFSSLENQPKKVFEVHTRMVEILRRIIQILDIDEDGHALLGVSYDHVSIVYVFSEISFRNIDK